MDAAAYGLKRTASPASSAANYPARKRQSLSHQNGDGHYFIAPDFSFSNSFQAPPEQLPSAMQRPAPAATLDDLSFAATQHLLAFSAQDEFDFADSQSHRDLQSIHSPALSPPCNNPNCVEAEDAIKCANDVHADYCEQDGCVGELCFKPDCQDVTHCDQACADETNCASPCFGKECEPKEPCVDDCAVVSGLDFCSAPSSVYTDGLNHPDYTFDYDLNHFHAMACGCVDPQCLSKDFCIHPRGHEHLNPASHSHDQSQQCGAKSLRSGQQSLAYNDGFAMPSSTSRMMSQIDTSFNFGTSTDPGTPALTVASSTTTPSIAAAHTPRMSLGPAETDALICQWTDGNRICGVRCDSAADLHAHTETAHVENLTREDIPNNGFYCHWAGCDRYLCRSFAAKPKLKRHLQTHTLHKPFECHVCGMKMKTKDAMEKHERTHTGSRPYVCSVVGCNKTFATSTELKTHMVVHSGAKPHICAICGEAFADSSNLSKHKKTHFLGMWRCDFCGTRMKRWDQMRRHVQTQGHMPELLTDEAQQKEYKARMEKEWRSLPDEERILSPDTRRGRIAF